MNAAVAEVMNMVVEDRIARLQSDVAEIKGDVKNPSETSIERAGERMARAAHPFG